METFLECETMSRATIRIRVSGKFGGNRSKKSGRSGASFPSQKRLCDPFFRALSKTHRDFARNVQGLVFSCHLFHSIIPLLAIFSRIGILAIAMILRSRNLNLIEQKVKLAFFDPMGVMLKTVGNYTSFLGNIVSYRPWLSTAAA